MDGAPSSRRFRAPGRLLARVERWRRQAYANSSVRSKPVSAAPDLCGAGPFNTALPGAWSFRGKAGVPFRRRGSAFLKGGEGPRRKVVRPALDDVYDSLDLAWRKLKQGLVGLPVPGDEV